MRLKLIQSALVICMLVPSFSFAATKWLDKVVALVESDVILDSEFKRRLRTVKKQLSSNGTELPPEDAIKKQVLEILVMDQIQLQKADRAGVRISDAALNSALNRIAESNNTTLVLMTAQIEADGLNFAIFREDIRQEMIIARYKQGAVSRNVFVSEQEVDDILTLMNEKGASSVSYRVRHLMIGIAESAGPDEIDRANAKVASIIERYKAGEVFSSLV
ncbi:MAG: peptidyl-prolyl cis-trans isomerase SurA, partial [Enterobacterales bacterium]